MNRHKPRKIALGLLALLALTALAPTVAARCSGYYDMTETGIIYSCSNGFKQIQSGCTVWCCPGSSTVWYTCPNPPTGMTEGGNRFPVPKSTIPTGRTRSAVADHQKSCATFPKVARRDL